MKTRVMFSLICILLTFVSCAAQEATQDILKTPAWQELFNMDFRDTTVGQALKDVIEPTGTSYTFENPDIKYLIIPILTMKQIQRIQALKTVVKASGLVYRVENSTIIIGLPAGRDFPWIKRVDVDVKSARLGDVLPDLFKAVGFNFTIDQEAVDLPVNSLKLTDRPFIEVLEKLLDNAGATYIDRGMYTGRNVIKIIPKQTSEAKKQPAHPQTVASGVTVTKTADNTDPWLRRINIEVKDALLSAVFSEMFRSTGLNYAVEPGLARVSIDSVKLTDVTFSEALEKVLDTADAVYNDEAGVVLIASKSARKTIDKVINLEVKDVALPQVMKLLFEDTGINYTIDPDISRLRITAALTNVPFSAALESLTAAAGLTYRIEKGVYRISAVKKASVDPASGNSNTTARPLVSGPAASGAKTDVPARWVSLQIKTEVTRPAKDKAEEKKNAAYPIISTLEGQTATVSVTRSGPPGPDGNKQLISLVSVSMIPTILADGKIQVSGTVDYVNEGYSARNIKILTIVAPGKPQKLPAISIPSTNDNTKAVMNLTLTVSL